MTNPSNLLSPTTEQNPTEHNTKGNLWTGTSHQKKSRVFSCLLLLCGIHAVKVWTTVEQLQSHYWLHARAQAASCHMECYMVVCSYVPAHNPWSCAPPVALNFLSSQLPSPADSSLTAESHSEQSSGSNCHKKKTCLSGWKQQSQWIHTTTGSEVNKMPQNAAPIVKQKRNQFKSSTHLFQICFDALEIFGAEFCSVLRQYVVYWWLLKIAFGNHVRK